jgi:hypothetical protein
MGKTGILICICLFTLLTACSNYNYNRDNNNSNHTNKEKPQTKEQITKELETITLFYDGSGNARIIALTSNDFISMLEKGSDDIDTIEFTVQDSILFFDMQRVLGTAKIDTALLIGEEIIDTVYKKVLVKNGANGYIIDDGSFKYTIPTTDSEYEILKNGRFKDIALNDTATKKIISFISYKYGKNDISADYMLLYQYKNKSVPNDTLCFGAPNRIVRINSYVAEVDSVLFKDVTDRISKLTYK